MWYTYILYSVSRDGYYTGSTSDPNSRLSKHNTHHKGFTGGALDWELEYNEVYQANSYFCFKRYFYFLDVHQQFNAETVISLFKLKTKSWKYNNLTENIKAFLKRWITIRKLA
ncbi:GIY-YIG nuclease family protein [Pedobacter sp.]|uniref:GIY-YIG nuclease family protein n=1 Tax=Pedobacter sp. TaxID=1411316 RepID=UPI00396C5DC7